MTKTHARIYPGKLAALQLKTNVFERSTLDMVFRRREFLWNHDDSLRLRRKDHRSAKLKATRTTNRNHKSQAGSVWNDVRGNAHRSHKRKTGASHFSERVKQ